MEEGRGITRGIEGEKRARERERERETEKEREREIDRERGMSPSVVRGVLPLTSGPYVLNTPSYSPPFFTLSSHLAPWRRETTGTTSARSGAPGNAAHLSHASLEP